MHNIDGRNQRLELDTSTIALHNLTDNSNS
jgi:hypothetical protein